MRLKKKDSTASEQKLSENKNLPILVFGSDFRSLFWNKTIVSIDETSFSHYRNDYESWGSTDPVNLSTFSTDKDTSTLTLLLAVSQSRILGYYILTTGINQVIFANFLKDVHDHLIESGVPRDKWIFVFDNARPHKTKICKSLLVKLKIQSFFTPAYSPEINSIEFIFGVIKRKYRKTLLSSKRSV